MDEIVYLFDSTLERACTSKNLICYFVINMVISQYAIKRLATFSLLSCFQCYSECDSEGGREPFSPTALALLNELELLYRNDNGNS